MIFNYLVKYERDKQTKKLLHLNSFKIFARIFGFTLLTA